MCPTPISEGSGAVRKESPEAGFTLAALIVILTIISIIVAYTVPTQWTLILRREREKQTIFLMKQFARAILTFQTKHQSPPVSLDQLREARQPRVMRGNGKWVMPLTGREDDWILVPPQAIEVVAGGAALPGGVPNQQGVGVGGNPQGGAMSPPSKLRPEASPKDYVGAFVAVRPNAKGPSLISLNGAEDYGQWVYTVQDLKNEIQIQQAALSIPR